MIFDLGGRVTRRRFLRGGLAVGGLVLLGPHEALAEHLAEHVAPPDTLEAGFLARSYRAGEIARLFLDTPAHGIVAQVFAHEPLSTSGNGLGAERAPAPTSAERRLRWPGGAGVLELGVGNWPTGLYFVSLRDDHGRTGSAPLVVRPSRLGEARTLVVMPTNTWGAYNFRDGATWYANPLVTEVDLTRPFLNGLPPHFGDYDRGFQRWLSRNRPDADVVSDDDLELVPSGGELRRRYDLIVFPGHEEYVTEHTYDIVERYQKLGGNLLFLSANNFFYKVVKDGNVMHGRWRWRDLGRPEAQMIGAQYLDWYQGVYRNQPLRVTDVKAAPWLFAGTGLRDGDTFGTYGIEIDACCAYSPPGVRVLASIPDIFGPGQTAQMTHYRTPQGAQVFDAGALNFGGTADQRVPGQMVSNLWRHLSARE